MLPFLIEDETPRTSRVPTGPTTEHPNGATGISRLLISARDVGKALEPLAARTDDRRARGATFRVGPPELVVVTADGSQNDVRQRLETSGSGPFAAELTVFDGGRGELDPEFTQGVRLRLG